jgi:formylglycine-generating enzyme
VALPTNLCAAGNKALIRKALLLLCGLAICSFAHTAPAEDLPEDLRKQLVGHGHALIIGVSNYQDKAWGPPLDGVEGQLQALQQGLRRHFKTVELVRNPTLAELQGGLRDFFQTKGDREDDRLFVFYVGHGFIDETNDMGYITGIDTPAYANDPRRAVWNALPMRDYDTFTRRALARHVLTVFDSCFAGTIFSAHLGGRAKPKPMDIRRVRDALQHPIRYYITAGGAKEEVPADFRFAELLLRGIEGGADFHKDGFITGEELGDYLKQEVPEKAGKLIHPRYGVLGDDEHDSAGEFLFWGGIPHVIDPPPRQGVFRDCPDCPEMVVIPAGSFIMGAPEAETNRERVPAEFARREWPQHRVTIGADFALGRYAVTRGEFAAFVKDTGYEASGCWVYDGMRWHEEKEKSWRDPGFKQTDRHPVTCVSYEDAQAYLRWLNEKVRGLGSTVSWGGGEVPYRLPSEAEWEYAARAGTVTARYWGDGRENSCDYANAADLTGAEALNWDKSTTLGCHDGYVYTAPVGTFRPNRFGLYDILGNVWQWTADCWNGTYDGAPNDGQPWTTGNCTLRALRGASWNYYPRILRAANRSRYTAVDRSYISGFRVARTISP